MVDGQKYYRKDGEATMVDETYIHQVENRSDVTRVILFYDIERPMSNPVLRWINRTISHGMIRAAATQNVLGEPVGVLNHIFAYVYRIRAFGIRIKEWHEPLHYLLKWCLIAAIGCAIIVGFCDRISFDHAPENERALDRRVDCFLRGVNPITSRQLIRPLQR